MNTTMPRPALDFELPAELSARQPPEATPGAERDDVRLMVSDGSAAPTHHDFVELPRLLRSGDLLVVNTSATLAAAIDGRTTDGERVVVHVSTELPSAMWLVEVRRPLANGATAADFTERGGAELALDGGAAVTLLARFDGSQRLWLATISLAGARSSSVVDHLSRFGRPIRYPYVERDWPLDAYRTVFARVPGSAEMPSASRPFTHEVVTELVTRGVSVAPLVLHTGVSSLEAHEMPYPERFDVPASTARAVNHARADGGRVIAVGTTVVRALESVVDDRGTVHPGQGWTDVLVTPERGAASVDGLLTGWHEPAASHLLMLDAVAAPGALAAAYDAAIDARYRWHEFGDVHLILR